MTDAPKAPKMVETLKMLVVPAVFMFSKKVDFTNPEVLQLCQMVFAAVVVVVLSIYYYIYTRITSKNDTKTIWVPPKPKPSLPFGLGPAPEPLKVEDFEKTTYKEYEMKMVQEVAQQTVMNAAITLFMGYQFKIHLSLLIQPVMIPLGLFEAVIFQKYVLGKTKQADGSNLYNELYKEPTAETIALLDRIAKARAAGSEAPAEEKTEDAANLTPSVAVSAIDKDEPRVEELSDKKPAVSSSSSAEPEASKAKKTTSAADELD